MINAGVTIAGATPTWSSPNWMGVQLDVVYPSEDNVALQQTATANPVSVNDILVDANGQVWKIMAASHTTGSTFICTIQYIESTPAQTIEPALSTNFGLIVTPGSATKELAPYWRADTVSTSVARKALQYSQATPAQALADNGFVKVVGTPTSGQVPAWNGSSYVPTTVSGGTGTTDHNALTASSRQLADQHPIGAITNLQSTLDGKASASAITSAVSTHNSDGSAHSGVFATPSSVSSAVSTHNSDGAAHSSVISSAISTHNSSGSSHSGIFALASHNQPASTIISGQFDIARIPTGTSSSTVSLGNHTHNSYPQLKTGTSSDVTYFSTLTGRMIVTVSYVSRLTGADYVATGRFQITHVYDNGTHAIYGTATQVVAATTSAAVPAVQGYNAMMSASGTSLTFFTGTFPITFTPSASGLSVTSSFSNFGWTAYSYNGTIA